MQGVKGRKYRSQEMNFRRRAGGGTGRRKESATVSVVTQPLCHIDTAHRLPSASDSAGGLQVQEVIEALGVDIVDLLKRSKE